MLMYLDDIGLFVHDDDSGGPEAGLGCHQRVEVHQHIVTHSKKSNQFIRPLKKNSIDFCYLNKCIINKYTTYIMRRKKLKNLKVFF